MGNVYRILLRDWIKDNGPIKAARVSSAQAQGRAKKYSYWGAVRYEIRLRDKDGEVISVARGRARSDRRSQILVKKDLDNLCESENRVPIESIGRISDFECECAIRVLLPEASPLLPEGV